MLVKAERPMPQILPFAASTLADAILGRCAAAFARFMTALHETRRQDAARALHHHRHLIEFARHESLGRPGDEP